MKIINMFVDDRDNTLHAQYHTEKEAYRMIVIPLERGEYNDFQASH